MNVKIARPSYIYGPAKIDDDRVWAQFIANVVRKQDILLKSNGAALRSFCYVTDTAAALLKIMLDGENMTPYNIANPKSDVTIRDFAKAAVGAFEELGLNSDLRIKRTKKEPGQLAYAVNSGNLDAQRLNSLGWNAQVDLTEGIKRSVKIVGLQLEE